MVFSKQFQQGETVAILPNNSNILWRIFYYKGLYLVLDYDKSTNKYYPVGSDYLETLLAKATNDAEYAILVNGTTLADIRKCIVSSLLPNILGINNAWSTVTSLPTSGYIEPVSITAIDDPLLAPILAYCVKLRKILKDNGIAFPGLEGVNF